MYVYIHIYSCVCVCVEYVCINGHGGQCLPASPTPGGVSVILSACILGLGFQGSKLA